MLDDLHALERAPLALGELTHTLDALDEAGAAVVVSARVGPGQWSGWPSRLVNRLVGGLSVRVEPPGPALRRRFVLDRARSRNLALAAEAVDALADSADGFRTLDGWLARLARGPLDRQQVEAILAEDVASTGSTIERIARAVAARFGLRLRDLRSSTRRAAVVGPRHLAIYLAREQTGQSFAAIGAYFGGRDSKTVRHACQMARQRLAADPSLAAAVASLRRPEGPDAS